MTEPFQRPRRPAAASAQRDAAEELATLAAGYIASDDELLSQFLGVTGFEGDVKGSAAMSNFLAAVLDYMMADEPLLLAFARAQGLQPEAIARAHAALAGPPAWDGA